MGIVDDIKRKYIMLGNKGVDFQEWYSTQYLVHKMSNEDMVKILNGELIEKYNENNVGKINGDKVHTIIVDEFVNHPKHYNMGKYEVIKVIEDSLGKEGFENYCVGNVIKYVMRYKYKNGIEDLKKALWYLDKVIELKELENRVCENCGGELGKLAEENALKDGYNFECLECGNVE